MGRRATLLALLERVRRAWQLAGALGEERDAAQDYLVSVDDWGGKEIRGWAIDKRAPDRPVRLCLMHRGNPVWSGRADHFRADLKEVGLSAGSNGFTIPRPDLVVDFVAGIPEQLALCVDRPGMPILAAIDLTAVYQDFQALYQRHFANSRDREMSLDREKPAFERRPASALLGKLFSPDPLLADDHGTGSGFCQVHRPTLPSAYSAFLRQTRLPPEYRARTEAGAPPDRLLAFLLAYAEHEPVAPLPFSADEIAYLNQSVFLGDAPYPLSRATTYCLAAPDPTRPTLDLTRGESYEALVAWWVLSKLPQLKAEDFLVSDAYRRVLMRNLRPGAHPVLSMPVLMRYLWANEPRWLTLLALPDQALPLLHARVLLQSLERPSLLQFLPFAEREHVLADWEARSQPGSFCPFPGRDKIESCLNAVGVSLDDPQPRHFSKEGHRARAFALPVPDDEPLDCQVIGPLDRASGLGQSARLLLEGLTHLPIKVEGFSFSLGNPQPLGVHNRQFLDRPRPARTHIFHLNPDQLPLALTQMPDMFEGARKVGMFYWELDKPAPGDQLALNLVDEIWVATEFCASIYRGFGKPVHVVGLPIPEPAPLGEEERRRLVRPYLPEKPGIRTILAMYDSLSWIERKNPRMAVDVFRRAFPGRPDVQLVLKTHNLERIADPRQRQIWAHVQEQALNDPRIIIIDQTMAPDALGALIASADVFLSLHRSEGLGLGLIEAMQRNVPVVATDYSGNRDFCLPDSSWPVAYDLVPVSPGDYAYADGRSRWAEPSAEHAVQQLRSALEGEERNVRVARARRHLVEKWSLHAFKARVSPLLM